MLHRSGTAMNGSITSMMTSMSFTKLDHLAQCSPSPPPARSESSSVLRFGDPRGLWGSDQLKSRYTHPEPFETCYGDLIPRASVAVVDEANPSASKSNVTATLAAWPAICDDR